MQLFDVTFKSLYQKHLAALLPMLLPELSGLHPIPEPTELPASVRAVDLLARGHCRIGDGPSIERILVVEFQAARDPELAATMFLRTAMVFHKHRRPVTTILICARPEAVVPAELVFGASRTRELVHEVVVCKLFELPAASALHTADPSLWPLATAMSTPDGNRQALLSLAIDQILDDRQYIDSDEKRTQLLTAAQTFATFSLSPSEAESIVQQSLERKHAMLKPEDFPMLKHQYDKGKAEGTAEGEARGMAKLLLLTLQLRSHGISPQLEEKLLACTDQALLASLLKDAMEGKVEKIKRALAA